MANRGPREKEAAWGKPLDAKRNYVSFLAATLGDFVVPVGVPLLSEIVLRDDSPDPRNILRRRLALHALSNLGDKIQGFAKLSATQQTEIFDKLLKETASTNPQRAARHATGSIISTKRSCLPVRWRISCTWIKRWPEWRPIKINFCAARWPLHLTFGMDRWPKPRCKSSRATRGRGHWHDSSIRARWSYS